MLITRRVHFGLDPEVYVPIIFHETVRNKNRNGAITAGIETVRLVEGTTRWYVGVVDGTIAHPTIPKLDRCGRLGKGHAFP